MSEYSCVKIILFLGFPHTHIVPKNLSTDLIIISCLWLLTISAVSIENHFWSGCLINPDIIGKVSREPMKNG